MLVEARFCIPIMWFRNVITGQSILKEVRYMKMIGTRQELDWLLETLANGCKNCPFYVECNQSAENEVNEKSSRISSCREFLAAKIEYEIIGE